MSHIIIIDGKKQCTQCKDWFPATPVYFYRMHTVKCGLRSKCKKCSDDNHTAYVETHQDEIDQYPSSSPEKHREYGKAYYYRNYESVKARRKRWRETYPLYRDQLRGKGAKRRAHKRAASGSYTFRDIHIIYKRQKGRCYYCHRAVKQVYDVDHVVPLSRGGSNDPSNLVIACPHCNRSKNNKLPHEWPEGGKLMETPGIYALSAS